MRIMRRIQTVYGAWAKVPPAPGLLPDLVNRTLNSKKKGKEERNGVAWPRFSSQGERPDFSDFVYYRRSDRGAVLRDMPDDPHSRIQTVIVSQLEKVRTG